MPGPSPPSPPCSIDPPGCTDVDDALSVRWLDGGSGSGAGPTGGRQLVEVGVHIADVSYFVRQVRAGPILRGLQAGGCRSGCGD